MTAFRRGKKIPNISERNERRRRRRQRRERKQLSRFLKSFPTRWFFVSLARFPPFHTQQHKTEPSLHSSLFLQFSILFLYSFYGLKKRRKISRDLSLRSGSSLLFFPRLVIIWEKKRKKSVPRATRCSVRKGGRCRCIGQPQERERERTYLLGRKTNGNEDFFCVFFRILNPVELVWPEKE